MHAWEQLEGNMHGASGLPRHAVCERSCMWQAGPAPMDAINTTVKTMTANQMYEVSAHSVTVVTCAIMLMWPSTQLDVIRA
jgi:hypothetical protein